MCYFSALIKSWRNVASRKVWEGERPNQFRGLDYRLALMRLQVLQDAETLQAIGGLRSVGLHKLKGNRRNQWAVSANGPFRICFEFHGGNAHNVEIVDYHKG